LLLVDAELHLNCKQGEDDDSRWDDTLLLVVSDTRDVEPRLGILNLLEEDGRREPL
jgi:hypothetical protein